MPNTEERPIKDARLPTVGEVGILDGSEAESIGDANSGSLKGCGHGYPGGKGCYVCDPDHPCRRTESAP